MAESTAGVSVEQKDGYLLMTLPPYQSRAIFGGQIVGMYDAAVQHGARLLLIDARATRKLVPILDLYELCILMVGKFGPLHPRIAVLVAPEAAYEDRFGENVMRSRGLDVIRFLDGVPEAIEWLQGEEQAPRR
jgi:hypothetical protein